MTHREFEQKLSKLRARLTREQRPWTIAERRMVCEWWEARCTDHEADVRYAARASELYIPSPPPPWEDLELEFGPADEEPLVDAGRPVNRPSTRHIGAADADTSGR